MTFDKQSNGRRIEVGNRRINCIPPRQRIAGRWCAICHAMRRVN